MLRAPFPAVLSGFWGLTQRRCTGLSGSLCPACNADIHKTEACPTGPRCFCQVDVAAWPGTCLRFSISCKARGLCPGSSPLGSQPWLHKGHEGLSFSQPEKLLSFGATEALISSLFLHIGLRFPFSCKPCLPLKQGQTSGRAATSLVRGGEHRACLNGRKRKKGAGGEGNSSKN